MVSIELRDPLLVAVLERIDRHLTAITGMLMTNQEKLDAIAVALDTAATGLAADIQALKDAAAAGQALDFTALDAKVAALQALDAANPPAP